MVQILQQGPSEYTLRQQALEDLMANFGKAYQYQKDEKTLRQKALEAAAEKEAIRDAAAKKEDLANIIKLSSEYADPSAVLSEFKGTWKPSITKEGIPAVKPIMPEEMLPGVHSGFKPSVDVGNLRGQDEKKIQEIEDTTIPEVKFVPGRAAIQPEYAPRPSLSFSEQRKQKIANEKALAEQRALGLEKTQGEISLLPYRKALYQAQAEKALRPPLPRSEKAPKERRSALDPKEKLAKMGAEAQSKVGSIASGLKALGGISKALEMGYEPKYYDALSPFYIGTLYSDNPFTANMRILSEVVGRLQSGGAIGDQELKSFNNMGPRAGDTPSVAKRKVEQQRSFLNNKLTAFGFDEKSLQEVGFDTGNKSKFSTSEKALKWANEHSRDPRASAVKEKALKEMKKQ